MKGFQLPLGLCDPERNVIASLENSTVISCDGIPVYKNIGAAIILSHKASAIRLFLW